MKLGNKLNFFREERWSFTGLGITYCTKEECLLKFRIPSYEEGPIPVFLGVPFTRVVVKLFMGLWWRRRWK